jgi:Undecaprenyl-phosphate glucose phosphotransferase
MAKLPLERSDDRVGAGDRDDIPVDRRALNKGGIAGGHRPGEARKMNSPISKAEILNFTPASARRSVRGGLQPQQVSYLSLLIDFVLFAAAGAIAWATTVDGTSLAIEAASSFAQMLVVFLICCRVAKLHDPLQLLHMSALERLPRVALCAGLPAAIPLATTLPFMMAGATEVSGFVSWLLVFEAAAVGLALTAHGFFDAMKPVLSKRILARQRIAVVGAGESAARLIRWIERTAPGMAEIIGVFDDRDRERIGASTLAHQVRGNTADLIELYKSAAFERIVIALPHSAEDRLLHLLRKLRRLPVDIVLGPDLMGFNMPEQEMAEVAGLNLLSLAHRPIREPQRLLKSSFDLAIAAGMVLLLSPLLLGIAVAIKLDSNGPVLFRQRRQGLGDRLFNVLKFRTMYTDLGDPRGANQTKRDDPRITRVGAILRKTSLDELPQLFNVLLGDMSLVGPRPHTPHMLIGDKRHSELVAEYSFRHRVKPGITGLAQVAGHRGAVDTPDQLRARVDLDLYYIDHWSLWLDIKILFRTALVCLSRHNAF